MRTFTVITVLPVLAVLGKFDLEALFTFHFFFSIDEF